MPDSAKYMVKDDILLIGSISIPVGSLEWYEWLSANKKFSYKGQLGHFLAQCETRRDKPYWYAYRRRAGKLLKVYLGKTSELTAERLKRASISFKELAPLGQFSNQPAENENLTFESRIDTSFLPMTKVDPPVLPRQLVTRPRLIRQMNAPLILIYAPSGFGKSTLLNDWKQACGYPIAWLSLDEHDNDLTRFWHSVVAAFRTIHSDFGKELLDYLDSTAYISPVEAVSRFTNDIIHSQALLPRFGLILDDFRHIHNPEIYDAIQVWLEHFPVNVQLVISGHTKPPLSLGHLRAQGLLTELDANDLRFTLEEGIHYLRQFPQNPPFARDDLEKLVKHAEGWAAGLTLTALAMGKQADRRQFIDTFSGAHIYLREYFMETVLRHTSPDVQLFLLKTAILKHLTGSLCDAVTGQTGCEEMLARLWQENLFIVRLEEQGWYRYHDLFAEMLKSQLQTRYPEAIPQLHRNAAQWYREQYAPADAIYHLLAAEAWEEAATLMEEMALRELEQFGEDSRLLRWLQELPERVVQRHKNLLFVYLRLANIALPKKKIEKFVAQIEMSISGKPDVLQTENERGVLTEIQQIRRIWSQGDIFTPPSRAGNEYDAKWDVVNRLHLLGQAYSSEQTLLDDSILNLLHEAENRHNLFVVLMAGGALVRRAIVAGQLRRGEKLARQILEKAIAYRGKLPGPASITLAALSQIHLERNEMGLARKYLDDAVEVDPNPASMNMPVQFAILRAKIQAAQNQMDEARVTIQSIRNLHLWRPSGLWSDQDLLAYEALICIRIGDIASAEQLLIESEGSSEHHLSQLVQAEISLKKNQFEIAEKQLLDIIAKYPGGIVFEPLMGARVSLALALFGQHKMNQALQIMTEAIRLAAPEKFFHPFLMGGVVCAPLLALVLEIQNLTSDARVFIKELLRLLDPNGKHPRISKAEMETLSISASISAREQEILHLLSAGYSNREMAVELSVSESTIKTHLGNIYTKLEVNSRVQAIARARKLNLV